MAAVSDASGAIVNEKGLDIKGLRAHIAAGAISLCVWGVFFWWQTWRAGLSGGFAARAALTPNRCLLKPVQTPKNQPPTFPAPAPPGNQLVDFGGGGKIPAGDLLSVPCDVLMPAAIGGVITGAPLLCSVRVTCGLRSERV